MASITIRQFPETTKRKLRIRAAENGHSMEQEAREILQRVLSRADDAAQERFAPFGGVELDIPAREPIPKPKIK